MGDPVLHVLAGPNGAGKSTFSEHVLEPATHLEFVNADVIAAQRWPEATVEHAYEAAQLAEDRRRECLAERRSFVAETLFSHPSKVDLLADAKAAGYLVILHVVLIPEALAVARVANRVTHGGHDVPVDKIRGRYERLWAHVRDAIEVVDETFVYDNSRARTPYRLVATFANGQLVGEARWPEWTPDALRLS